MFPPNELRTFARIRTSKCVLTVRISCRRQRETDRAVVIRCPITEIIKYDWPDEPLVIQGLCRVAG